MSVSTIYVTYSGHWENFSGGGDTFSSLFSVTSRPGHMGEVGGLKLRHDASGDRYTDCGIGYAQFDTSSIPVGATISSALLNTYITKNSYAFGGVGMAVSTMAVGSIPDGGVDEWTSGNILSGNLTPESGVVDFTILNPNSNIIKGGWSKYHIGTSHVMDRTSPGNPAIGNCDFNIPGYDTALDINKPKLVITWTTPPAVTTGSVANLQPITATFGGEITDNGGGTVSTAGVCWSTSTNPTTSDSKATTATVFGTYAVSATNLLPGTLYHYRAYVTTENSTTYGADVTVRTPGGAILFNLL